MGLFETISLEGWIAIVGASVGVFTLVFAVVRHWSESRLIKLRATFDAKHLMRTTQMDVATRLFSLVGRLLTPQTEEQFDSDWYDFMAIGTCELYLLPDAGLHTAYNNFAKVLIVKDEYELIDEFDGKPYENWQNKARIFSETLNNFLVKQFLLKSPIQQDTKSLVGPARKRSPRRKAMYQKT